MNELSWLIYLADVVGSLKGLAAGALFLSGLCTVAIIIAWFCADPSGYVYSFQDKEALQQSRSETRSLIKKISRWVVVVSASSAFTIVVVPTSGTIYAIAASEMGERVLKSETAGKAVQALNAWLDRQIAASPK